MKELMDKLSSYNIFNYLLPGIVFVVLLEKVTHFSFIQKDIVLGVFVYYFIGLIISRLGSLIIEPILKKIKFIEFAPYSEFVSASKIDSKLEILSESNNMYRTFCSLFLLLILLKLFEWIENKLPIISDYNEYILVVALFVLFIFSFKKQTNYVRKRVLKLNNKE